LKIRGKIGEKDWGGRGSIFPLKNKDERHRRIWLLGKNGGMEKEQ